MAGLYNCQTKGLEIVIREITSIPLLFLPILLFIEKHITIMEYKRQYRDLPDEVKQKISASTKGKAKSYDHKLHISQGMKKYWSTVESRPTEGENQ